MSWPFPGAPPCQPSAGLTEGDGTSPKASLDSEGLLVSPCPTPLAGLTVNGQITGDKRDPSAANARKTYFGKLGITNTQMDFRMEVTTKKITLWNGARPSTFTWLDTVTVTQDG